VADLEDARHGLSSRDPLVGMARHRFNVMRQQNATFMSGPLQDDGIDGSCEAYILDTNDVQGWITEQKAAENVFIKVFVGCQAKHGLASALLIPAGEQPFTDAPVVEPGFILPADFFRLPSLLLQVGVDLGLVPQVIADDGIHVRQGQGVELPDDILSGGARLKSVNYRIQGDPGATDPDDTVHVRLQGDGLRCNRQISHDITSAPYCSSRDGGRLSATSAE
jgi:hypothetical protein